MWFKGQRMLSDIRFRHRRMMAKVVKIQRQIKLYLSRKRQKKESANSEIVQRLMKGYIARKTVVRKMQAIPVI